ncbi:MAG TPA: ABC transporter substrate-binding protein [Anaerolineales bacterium]|nr:ABC transporter substrate-binding protein [Anaerolineales bacterium]
MKRRTINRRDFLKVSAMTIVGTVATACGAAPTAAPEPGEATQPVQATVAAPTTSKEPPLLQSRVDSGELPPLDERLPESPLVVADREAIGAYGGEVRMIHFDPVWMISNYDWMSERMLHYSDMDLRTIVPNIFESWEVSPDGTTFTFRLRKGMKFSDGQPLTTEDVRFYYEDYWFNTDLNASPMWQIRFDGKDNSTPAKLDIADEYTFTLTYAAPFGALPAHLTRWEPGNWPGILGPSHFYKKFHNKYTDQAKLDEMAKAASLETWVQLFNQHLGWGMGVWRVEPWMKDDPYPVLSAWQVVETPQEGLFIFERNPYYWKVDVEGNQLPYIDNLRMDYITTAESAKLKLAQNELDALGQHDVTMADYAFYKENETAANFQVMDYVSVMSDRDVFFPQHVIFKEDGTLDDVMTEIAQHPNFVKALSVAIDREEINESLLFGTARMGQLAPVPSSKYYKEEYGTAWAQFDKDLANQLLDEMGLDQKNAQGIRLRKDGEPLTYVIEQAGLRVGPLTPKMSELIAAYWRDIGIDASSKEVQESLLNERLVNGQVHCTVWHADRCSDLLLPLEMRWYIPTDQQQGGPSSVWARWYGATDKTTEGLVEPPDQIKKYYDLFAKMTSTTDEDERVKFGQEIFDGLAETPLSIGLILEVPAPLIFNKNMRNLARAKALVGWDTYGNSTFHPEAFFYEGGQRA